MSVEAVNFSGQKVFSHEGVVSSGKMVTVPLAKNGKALPNGTYIIRYKTPELQGAQRVYFAR